MAPGPETIAVRRREEVEGFGPWTVKAGVPHVQPPTAVLQGILALRLHLDDCGPENGALRVLPGSHTQGRLNGGEITAAAAGWREMVLTAGREEVLAMRPLLLQKSSPAARPEHRRVLHIEFAAGLLPKGLEWAVLE